MLEMVKQLEQYVPESCAPILAKWIVDTGCTFTISKARTTKFGDYRVPYKGQPHRITVNYNLNKYSFLITTVHEFAHLMTFDQYQNKVKPHGQEWKKSFQFLMNPFMNTQVFPKDILAPLTQYMKNPAASSSSDTNLFRALRQYDTLDSSLSTVENIAMDSLFKLENGRVFQKKEKARKRYKCIELNSHKVYLFHPIAQVQKI